MTLRISTRIQVLAEDFNSYITVKKSAVEFKQGMDRTDKHQSCRLRTWTTNEQDDAIHRVILWEDVLLSSK